ncbi:family 16 glycoside hydrolase [Streptomyces echinatus]|uniref:family 16 glycoside hydrolase n=1 Tax=Streptomyces echinatus TaxID=67293 RepID=UPI003CD0B55E
MDGWRQAGPGGFTLSDDGTLTSTGGLGLLWYTPSSFGSYSLKLDWKAAGDDNSGVFVGFPPSDDPWCGGRTTVTRSRSTPPTCPRRPPGPSTASGPPT